MEDLADKKVLPNHLPLFEIRVAEMDTRVISQLEVNSRIIGEINKGLTKRPVGEIERHLCAS